MPWRTAGHSCGIAPSILWDVAPICKPNALARAQIGDTLVYLQHLWFHIQGHCYILRRGCRLCGAFVFMRRNFYTRHNSQNALDSHSEV